MDHCKAIDLIYHQGKSGETYNIGGHNEKNNLQIVHSVCRILDEKRPRKEGKYADLISFVTDRPGHDLRYAIDPSKIHNELGWMPETKFEDGLKRTIRRYCWEKSTQDAGVFG